MKRKRTHAANKRARSRRADAALHRWPDDASGARCSDPHCILAADHLAPLTNEKPRKHTDGYGSWR